MKQNLIKKNHFYYHLSMAGDGGGRNIENIEEEQRKRLELKDDLIAMRDRFTAEESLLVKKSNMLNVQVCVGFV